MQMCFALVATSIASASMAQFVPIDLATFYNSNKLQFCCQSSQYPLGNATYQGVPFYLGPATGNNLLFLTGTNPVTVDIPVNQQGVQRVRTLINTAWGQSGPNSYLRVEFIGLDDSVYSVSLVGGQHIRDHGPAFVQTFNPNPPTCTRNVWVSTNSSVRMDMQTFALPASIRVSGLRTIRFIDTGGTNFQRGMIFGVTLDQRLCEANINEDCVVDFFDYLDFVDLFSSNSPEADFNGDGGIDFFDYLDYVDAFSTGC